MIYFANPTASTAVHDAMTAGLVGLIDTPHQGSRTAVNRIRQAGVAWCADNGAFTAKWTAEHWWAWLTAPEQLDHVATCYFATAPDVVGNYDATLEASLPWLDRIRELGYPVALVAQNGMEHSTFDPWDLIDALFIGGVPGCPYHGAQVKGPKTGSGSHQKFFCRECHRQIPEWKLGEEVANLAAVAASLGKHVHMGRVSSRKRYEYARAIGCSSVDGTFLIKGPDKLLPELLGWVRGANQDGLFVGPT